MNRSFTPLLDRISQVETLGEIEAACHDRFHDALALGTESRCIGAIYLFGYVIEMCIKSAYYRTVGAQSADDVTPHLRRARHSGRNQHDIVAWADWLVLERVRRDNPLDSSLAGVLMYHARTVAAHWREWLRYRREQLASDECELLFSSAAWMLNNRNRLWS